MTSPSRGEHPSTDSISDLLEGLLPPAIGRATAEHLEHCAQCLAVRDALVRTHDVLQTAGRTPPPIPPDVFDRVEAGLRAESQSRAQTTGVASLTAARERRSGGWKTKVLGVAAALALFGGGGTVLVQAMQPEENFAADPGPEKRQDGAAEPDKDHAAPGDAPSTTMPSLTASDFGVGVRHLMKTVPGIGETDPGVVATDPLADLHPGDAACVSRLLAQAGADRPIAAAETTFDGDEVILVVTDATDSGSIHGYAIAGCDTDTPEIRHDEVVPE